MGNPFGTACANVITFRLAALTQVNQRDLLRTCSILFAISHRLSFNVLADRHPLAGIPMLATATAFDLLDQLTSNMLLPATGLALAIFGGWIIPPTLLADELHLGASHSLLFEVYCAM